MLGPEKNLKIIFVVDDRISHERMAILSRAIQGLRQTFTVDLIQGAQASEALLLEKLQTQEYALALIPNHRYSSWSRIEGYLGINRTSGPTVAGYFCEPLQPTPIGDAGGLNRKILLDLVYLQSHEIVLLVRSLILDTRRSGIRPLLEPASLIYCESWYGNQGLGFRIDQVLALPEIAKTDWMKRASSIRMILLSFWSLVYEEGPGKSEIAQAAGNRQAKAYLQLGADANCLAFRLYYYTVPHKLPKDLIYQYSHRKESPTEASQNLLRNADFLRVHPIHETSDIEVVAGIFRSAPSEKAYDQVHTLWIEPLSARLISEPPFEAPSPQAPHLRALPTTQVASPQIRAVDPNQEQARNRILVEATGKIKELKEKVQEKEEIIRELKSGGIGTAPPLPEPDAEAFLEAFQEKYMDAKLQIRQFELQILELEKRKATQAEIEDLKQKMEALQNRERAWIKKILATLDAYKSARKKI